MRLVGNGSSLVWERVDGKKSKEGEDLLWLGDALILHIISSFYAPASRALSCK